MKNKPAIAKSFGRAAPVYDRAAAVQRLAAQRLAARLVAMAPDAPGMLLDVGCGTGAVAAELAAAWPEAAMVLADLAPPMLAVARGKLLGAAGVAADADSLPFARESFDLVASNLALQWCDDVASVLRRLAGLLRPGGVLGVTTLLDGSWASWRRALAMAGEEDVVQPFPAEAALREATSFMGGFARETLLRPYGRGREFVQEVAQLGAGVRDGAALSPAGLARALAAFEAIGPVAEYELATLWLKRPPREAVLVSGTDTGVGKTVVSAILAKGWGADYWKPAQTGLAQEPGDSDFLRRMGVRVHPSRLAFQAPLSPYAAGLAEGVAFSLADFVLPEGDGPLVVEGAGGIACPLDATHDMADLALHLGLPVVLVARSGLGTINHTLLAINHARAKGVRIVGVVMVGDQNSANREEIVRRGNVQILLECPHFERLDQESIALMAAQSDLGAKLGWQF